MNKTAIKYFAIWARNKLIADISYKAGLLGITEKGIKSPLPQSTQTVQFFDIGTKEPSSVTGVEIQQRKRLVEEIERKAKQSDYATAYKNVIEEVAYTWFNRLIAIRFMEVNDYLPTRIRVLSSEGTGKAEPDLVTHAMEASFDYSAYEKDRIIQLKHDNKLDELFRMLFIKQCNALNSNLPELFEKTNDYTELLLNVSFTDKEGVVYHLVNDISEDNFNVTKEGQVEIIGWMYQYYNTEPKQSVFDDLKRNVKITKEKIPAATQLFTPDWIVRYMVENSLGRLWLESHPSDTLKANWKYYLAEAEQTPEVAKRLRILRSQSLVKSPENIRLIDPCMGSGHILVYAFDVLMRIYESEGYNPRDAAKLILEKNVFGLDIDHRAYQLAYFSLMMKARQYNRRIFTDGVKPQVYHPTGFPEGEEFGSLVKVDILPPQPVEKTGQLSFDDTSYYFQMNAWNFQRLLAQKYDVVVTNPPYMSSSGMAAKLSNFVTKHYPDSKSDMFSVYFERCAEMTKVNCLYAMIVQPSILSLNSFSHLRKKKLRKEDLLSLLHMGRGIFGIDFGSTSFVFRKCHTPGYIGNYYRLHQRTFQYVEPTDIEKLLQNTINNPDYRYDFTQYTTDASITNQVVKDPLNMLQIRFTAIQDEFLKVPNSPFTAYALSKKVLSLFDNPQIVESVQFKEGLTTANNDLFLRRWYEIAFEKIVFDGKLDQAEIWVPYNKGGAYRMWYGNHEYVVNWAFNGKMIRDYPGSSFRNAAFQMKVGGTFSAISAGRFSARLSPNRFAFDSKGTMFFSDKSLEPVIAYLNSNLFNELLKIVCPTMDFRFGTIQQLPMLDVSYSCDEEISIAKEDWDSGELSWNFTLHPMIQNTRRVSDAYTHWINIMSKRRDRMRSLMTQFNTHLLEKYNLIDEFSGEFSDKDISLCTPNLADDIKSLISYAVGCMVGRYSLDIEGLAYAGGEWDTSKYRTFIPDEDNIIPICDDEYFDDDIMGRFVNFIRVVYGANTLEENLKFIANALGGKGTSREVIRNYFMNEFYKVHCKIYQKRPIYWLFDSGKKNSFKALIYMHRYDENTIGNLRVDYLHRIQRIYENEIVRMQDTIENSKDAREVTTATKRKEKLIKQLQETKEYDEKIAHLALARTPIDLDDGVKVNYEKVQTDRDGKKLDVLAKI